MSACCRSMQATLHVARVDWVTITLMVLCGVRRMRRNYVFIVDNSKCPSLVKALCGLWRVLAFQVVTSVFSSVDKWAGNVARHKKKISFAVLCLWQIYLRSRSPFAFVITEIAPLQEDIRCTKYVVGFYIYRWSKMYGCNTFRNNHILRHYNKNIFVVLLNWIQSLAAALATRKVAFIHLTKAAQFVFGERNVLVRAHAV